MKFFIYVRLMTGMYDNDFHLLKKDLFDVYSLDGKSQAEELWTASLMYGKGNVDRIVKVFVDGVHLVEG